MRALNSRFVLIDLHTSWQSQNSKFISTVSPAFRRTRRAHNAVASSSPSIRSPEIRRPSDRFVSGNGSHSSSPNTASTSSSSPPRSEASDATELEMFLELLPPRMRRELYGHEEIEELIEVVMDLGRKPIARFPSGDWIISEDPIKDEDLRHAISKVGDFSDDNRSGINNSLHRISAIRNRKMQIIGLTCRVGRAVSGSAEIIHDLLEGGGSILVIGPPGVGKTTLIREIARMLADEHMKRVVIVDTSNEIGGDGDIPHAGIGRARRMQVPNVNLQHNVMIEAVENHMPETIIIDEIGTELEALAASTIAQRGVQLVGTAHGMTIDNIIKNPSLQILVGGIESVTLGDEEAKKRKVQKTILERKGPSTFTCAVELISKYECRVHHRLDATVDAILAGKSPLFEIRKMDADANDSQKATPISKIICSDKSDLTTGKERAADIESDEEDEEPCPSRSKKSSSTRSVNKRTSPVRIYTYKILEADLLQVATVMGLEDQIDVTDDIGMADAILACSSEMKQNPWIRSVAKFHQMPVFVMKSNTMAQMVKAVRMIIGRESYGSLPKPPFKKSFDIEIEDDGPERKPSLEEIDALEEVRLAIEYIVIPGGEPVELLPRRSEIIARQLELVESYQLAVENSEQRERERVVRERVMAGKEDYRIFVGGLSWNVTERQLENAFARFGKVLEAQIMMERDTGRPRGFGFITFGDRRGMEDAIREMHGREFGDRIISVNKAQPKMGDDDADHGYRGSYSSGGRKGYGGGDRSVGQDDCFKCGRPGHWARDCPSAGGGRGGGRFGDRFGGASGRGDRFGGDRDRYLDDRYDAGRYGERDRVDSRDSKYGSRDRYGSDRYQPADRFANDRYNGADRYPLNGYGKDRGFDRDGGPRGGDRYGSGGPARNEGKSYRSRPDPYDRPNRGGRPSSFDRY